MPDAFSDLETKSVQVSNALPTAKQLLNDLECT